jgi:hypothetical protein
MWQYQISTGELLNNAGNFIGTGYSGVGLSFADGRNNPTMVSDPDVGPIPPGFYQIGLPYQHPTEGPCVMNLTPIDGTNDFGRSAFHIHGNNVINNASKGCIILGPSIRQAIANSGDNELKVII